MLGVNRTDSTSIRKLSTCEPDEEIEIKPSTELIPDEYQRSNNDKIGLHIFSSAEDGEISTELFNTFQELDFDIDKNENIHPLFEKKKFLDDLEEIKQSCDKKSGLILIFLGYYSNDGKLILKNKEKIEMHSIWNEFSAHKCSQLKEKPKIFIFCVDKFTSPVQADSRHAETYNKDYDFPAESDMLIVFNQTGLLRDSSISFKNEFVGALCDNIKSYSKQHDIIDLVTHRETDNDLEVVENSDFLTQKSKDLTRAIEKRLQYQKQKQEAKTKTRFLSFRRKKDDKPKISKRDSDLANVQPDSGSSKTVKEISADKLGTVKKQTTKNLSVPTVQRRTTVSESSNCSKDKKVPWKY